MGEGKNEEQGDAKRRKRGGMRAMLVFVGEEGNAKERGNEDKEGEPKRGEEEE